MLPPDFVKPAFVILTGFSPDTREALNIKKYLGSLGYSALVSNFWGHPAPKDLSTLSVEHSVKRLGELVKKAKQQYSQKIIGIGICLGGAFLMEYAKTQNNLDCIVSIGTPFKLKKKKLIDATVKIFPFISPVWKALKKFKRLRLRPVETGKMLLSYLEGQFLEGFDKIRTPVLFMHSRRDRLTDFKALGEYTQKFTACRKQVIVFEKVNHVINYDSQKIVENVFKFISTEVLNKG